MPDITRSSHSPAEKETKHHQLRHVAADLAHEQTHRFDHFIDIAQHDVFVSSYIADFKSAQSKPVKRH